MLKILEKNRKLGNFLLIKEFEMSGNKIYRLEDRHIINNVQTKHLILHFGDSYIVMLDIS